MKLSNKGRYSIQAVFDMAFHGHGDASQIKDIAERQAIPPRFLEQIFQDLKRGGLVVSKRGPRGGYRLARPASAISLGDVVRAVEGPVTLLADPTKAIRGTSGQVVTQVFVQISERIEACFDAVSIEQLCERSEQIGIRRSAPRRLSYVI